MARYPGAQWRPLGRQTEPRLTKKNIVVLHTMVGSLGGTDSYFRQGGYDGVESHFGVGHDGTVYQWQDTNYQADAQGDGNDNCISIETADVGTGFPKWSGSNVPAWTDAQVDALVDLVAWLCDTHDIPKRLIPDSGAGRRGIGYHRLGVDPWRKAGCERWSSAYGKVCPGDRRIAQISSDIIPRLDGHQDDGGDDMGEFRVYTIKPVTVAAGARDTLLVRPPADEEQETYALGADMNFDITVELETTGSGHLVVYQWDPDAGEIYHDYKPVPIDPIDGLTHARNGIVTHGRHLRLAVQAGDLPVVVSGGRVDMHFS